MATAAAATVRYGAVELKSVQQKYWTYGLLIAMTIHLMLVGTFFVAGLLRVEEPLKVIRIRPGQIPLPPPLAGVIYTPPPVSVSTPVVKPAEGAPIPVPDAEVSPDQTIASQTELNRQDAPNEAGSGQGEVIVQPEIKIEADEVQPPDVVLVEKWPVVVRKVKPQYPELAIRAELEGTVWVKIWVDKEGKPKQAVVVKSDAEIFNDPAIEAAKQFVFAPAYMNNGPVSVWVSIPFRFKLADKK